jgi:superoxide dismutase, Fe-Mn family
VADYPELGKKSVEDLLRNLDSVPEPIRTAVRNFGGGHANHALYWQIMSKSAAVEPAGELANAIDRRFGSFSSFKDLLTRSATGVFGSGWAWLSLDQNKQLAIVPTSNQDTPLSMGHTPLACIDVWEHAYYLKYQNRRADYVAAFHKVLNWDLISERYSQLVK